jgi:signal transduction histidine kinase/ligand-binding sensor domain-containing protein/DNA-binding response OmpR family regulator
MRRIYSLLILIFFLINIQGISQTKLIFKKIDNLQGLSQNGVLAIFQDKEGYMWFGTHYGLNRYDGFTFKNYYRGDSYNDLCGNTIQSILQDAAGNIWIATIEGIAVFNPVTEKFYNLNKYSQRESVFKQTILSMKLIDSNILISSNDGIWKFNPGNELFTEITAKNICTTIDNHKLQESLKLEGIRVYQKDNQDNYLLTANDHVIISKIIDNKLIVIDEIALDSKTTIEVTALYKDSFSNFWAGTAKHGLYQIKESQGKYSTIKVYPQKTNTTFSRVTDIIQDDKNKLWIISRSDGVIAIPKEKLEKNIILPISFSELEIPSKRIRSIYKSHDNTLWLGSLGRGIFFSNPSGIKFKNYQFSNQLSNSSNSSLNNYSRSISSDFYNRLWFGTLFEGLCIYDTEKEKIIKYLLKNLSIFSLSEVDKNHYFAGTSDGLYLITHDKENFKTDKITFNNKVEGVVFSICKKYNKYWIGTSNKLLSFVLTDDFKFAQVVTYDDKLLVDHKSQNTIRCVKFDQNHNCIWIGTEMNGLIKAELDSKDNISRFVSINNMYKDYSISKYISDIYLDTDNNYWIGTRNGLVHFRMNDMGKFSDMGIYTTNDGLPSNMIQSIQSDTKKNIWLGTNRGLVKFNKFSHDVINYDINDGIQDYEFAEHASYVDNTGILYFGGINGVSRFSPEHMNSDSSIEPVFVQNIFINGINANEIKGLDKSKNIVLPHSSNNLKFSFISFNYINPSKCKYAYMLEGYDKDWIYCTSENRFAEYANLDKGNYIFKVKASNHDGVWNTNFTSIPLEIQASFWQTLPAFLFYFFILFVLIFFVSSITKKRVQKKQAALLEKEYHEKIEKVNQAKIQFFINISHEIRTPLTLIMCSVEKLIGHFKINPEQEKEVGSIEKNISHMLNLTNELLEIQKIESGAYQINVRKDNIVEFLKDIIITFEPLADRQKIKLIFTSFESEIFIWYDANALVKALNNLISNAIKYTKSGGNIEVSVTRSNNNEFLDINVSDDGIGIEKENLTKIFNQFYHIAGNSESYEKGFGVGLPLTKNLIELHKGSISISSEPGIGSTFTISLPLQENVYSKEEKVDRGFWNSGYTSLLSSLENNISNETTHFLNDNEENLDPSKSTILYVDDNKELVDNIRHYLSEKYNVLVASNGQIGIELANQFQPDVIISDIIMPIKDGFELCRDLKNDVNTSHIPIILLTARGDSESQFRGIEIGADHFFPKPFNINLLDLTIKNFIESREKLRQLFINNPYHNPNEITTNSRDAEFLEKLLKYVDEHIDEPDLNINSLAQTFAMSRSTFFRKIKAITGTTGKDFVDSIKLKKAAHLLVSSDMNISEVAYTIGHSNPQYFSKWFKAFYKVSPSEYILQHKSN